MTDTQKGKACPTIEHRHAAIRLRFPSGQEVSAWVWEEKDRERAGHWVEDYLQKEAQVAALVGALEAQKEADTYFTAERIEELDKLDSIERKVKAQIEWGNLHDKAERLRAAALANLPAEAREIARKAQAHDEMKAELERLTIGFESLRQSLTVMQPEYECLKAEVERLREALMRYGRHAPNCRVRGGKFKRDCTCGFSAALAERKPE